MKVIVVHGDNIEKSYQRLQKFISVAKRRGWEIERLSGKNTESVPEVLSSTTLFNDERLFILEDATKISKKHLEWIKENSKSLPGTLVIFEEGFLGKRILNKLPEPDKAEEFKHPKLIYKFLESLYPGNQEKALNLLSTIKQRQAPEYITAILGSHLRDVYIAMIDPSGLNYPGWRVGKLKGQAKKFTEGKLKSLIKGLSEADFSSKTTSEDFYSSLDLIIATKLE